MSIEALEERLTAVEAEVRQLKQAKETDKSENDLPWWEKIRGRFKDDPAYDEAMRLGREWRDAENAKSLEEYEC